MLGPKTLKKLGIDPKKVQNGLFVNSIQQLKKEIPYYVNGQFNQNGSLFINNSVPLDFSEGDERVMSLTLYEVIKRENPDMIKPSKNLFKDMYKRYQGEDLTNKTLLIWRWGGIGDLIFIQPIVKYLKSKYKGLKIIFSSSELNLPILKMWGFGLIDEYVGMPFPSYMLEEADYHLTFEGVIERCKDAKRINAYDLFQTMASVNFDIKDFYPSLLPNSYMVMECKEKLPDNLVICHCRASSAIRTMEFNRWVNIGKELIKRGYTIGFIDSVQYAPYYDRLSELIDPDQCYNLSRFSSSLVVAVSMISAAKAVIGIDSAMLHIAACVNVPLLGIFASFDPTLRLSYYKNAKWCVPKNKSEVNCKYFPCFLHEVENIKCKDLEEGLYPGCFNAIKDEDIMNTFDQLMSEV